MIFYFYLLVYLSIYFPFSSVNLSSFFPLTATLQKAFIFTVSHAFILVPSTAFHQASPFFPLILSPQVANFTVVSPLAYISVHVYSFVFIHNDFFFTHLFFSFMRIKLFRLIIQMVSVYVFLFLNRFSWNLEPSYFLPYFVFSLSKAIRWPSQR